MSPQLALRCVMQRNSMEKTNLLPNNRQRALVRESFVRMLVVVCVLITVLVGITAALLIPTYIYLQSNTSVQHARLTGIEANLSSNDDTTLSTEAAVLSSNAARLTALSDTPPVSTVMREMLAIAHPNITLTGFSYTAHVAGSPATLVISGTAVTRDDLRDYQLQLQGASFASSATLPVSAYAQESNIPFAITVTFAP
jgi:Tfp pilus assembly protein PilN